jgi:hypothetical protein
MDEASEDDLFELNVLSNLAEISSDVVDFPVPPAIINGNFLSPFKWDGYSYGLNKPGVNEDGSLTGYYICSKKKSKDCRATAILYTNRIFDVRRSHTCDRMVNIRCKIRVS